MIGLSITNIGDSQLAKALLYAVGDRFEFYLNFKNEELLDNFGSIEHKHGCDLPYLLMHGNALSAFISFSAPPNKDQIYNLTLVNFFNDIAVPTIEIQHGLFQYGINNLDHSLRCGFDANGGGWGLPFAYPAKHLIPWVGDDGIGYLKSALPKEQVSEVEEPGYILITSNLNWHIYTDQDRYAFVIAILSLAVRYPHERFVWKPHGAEWDTKFKHLFDMIFAQNLENLRIFTPEEVQSVFAESLIPGCKLGISTVSTTLLDYQIAQKPVLVFKRLAVQHMVDQIDAKTFYSGSDLLAVFDQILSDQTGCFVDTKVNRLDVSKLTMLLAAIQKSPSYEFSAKSVGYLRHFEAMNNVTSGSGVESRRHAENSVKDILSAIIKPNANYTIEDILRSIEGRIDIRGEQTYAKILADFKNVLKLIETRIDLRSDELRTEMHEMKYQLTAEGNVNVEAVQSRIDIRKEELYSVILQDFQNVLQLLEKRMDFRKEELQEIVLNSTQLLGAQIGSIRSGDDKGYVDIYDAARENKEIQ